MLCYAVLCTVFNLLLIFQVYVNPAGLESVQVLAENGETFHACTTEVDMVKTNGKQLIGIGKLFAIPCNLAIFLLQWRYNSIYIIIITIIIIKIFTEEGLSHSKGLFMRVL